MKKIFFLALLGLSLAGRSSGQFVFLPVGDPDEPRGVSSGPDGNIWFTLGNQVGRMTPSGAVTKYSLPTANAVPTDIVTGPDGNLWFLETGARKVGRISTNGTITEFSAPDTVGQAIVVGSDGALWFLGGGGIWRVTVSGGFSASAAPASSRCLAPGSDGNLWFVQYTLQPHHVGRATLSGVVTLFARPSQYPGWSCSAGSDGNVWYTTIGNVLGFVTPSGSITERRFGDEFSLANSITAGPDGNIWMPIIEAGQCIVPCPVEIPPRPGVVRVSPDGTQSRFDLTQGLKLSGSTKIAPGPSGTLWLTAESGLIRFLAGQFPPSAGVPILGSFARAILLASLAVAGLFLLRR